MQPTGQNIPPTSVAPPTAPPKPLTATEALARLTKAVDLITSSKKNDNIPDFAVLGKVTMDGTTYAIRQDGDIYPVDSKTGEVSLNPVSVDNEFRNKIYLKHYQNVEDIVEILHLMVKDATIGQGVLHRQTFDGDVYVIANTDKGFRICKESELKKHPKGTLMTETGLKYTKGFNFISDGDPRCLQMIEDWKVSLLADYQFGQALSSARETIVDPGTKKEETFTMSSEVEKVKIVVIQSKDDHDKGLRTGLRISYDFEHRLPHIDSFRKSGRSGKVTKATARFTSEVKLHNEKIKSRAEATKLIGALRAHNQDLLKEKGIFRESARDSELNKLREDLKDPNFQVVSSDAILLAGALKEKIRNLNIFGPFYNDMMNINVNEKTKVVQEIKNLVNKLSTDDKKLLGDFMKLLNEAVKKQYERTADKMTVENFGIVIGPNLAPNPVNAKIPKDAADAQKQMKIPNTIVKVMIENHVAIFA